MLQLAYITNAFWLANPALALERTAGKPGMKWMEVYQNLGFMLLDLKVLAEPKINLQIGMGI